MRATFVFNLTNTLSFFLAFLFTFGALSRHLFLLTQQQPNHPPRLTSGISSSAKGALTAALGCRAKSPIFHATLASLLGFTLFTMWSSVWKTAELMGVHASQPWCDASQMTASYLYSVGKYSMYLVFLLRTDTVFRNTIYQHPAWLMTALYLLLALNFTGAMIAFPFRIRGKSVSMKGAKWAVVCLSDVDPNVSFYGAMIDVAWNVIALGLFIQALRKMFSTQRSRASFQRDRMGVTELEMEMLPWKYGLLTAIVTVSTCVALLLFGVSRIGTLIALDTAVNVGCLVLMTGVWKHTYWWLCSPLWSCLANSGDQRGCLNQEYRMGIHTLLDHYRPVSIAKEPASLTGSVSPS